MKKDLIEKDENLELIKKYENKGRKPILKLLFKMNRDVDTIKLFHILYDNKRLTVTIIEIDDNYKFRWFTNGNWHSNYRWGNYGNDFAFNW